MRFILAVFMTATMILAASKAPVVIMTTTQGVMELTLRPDIAPKAVENFVGLVQRGYYNGISFHRIIKGFMIQGGDPTGTGRGGDSIWGRPFANEYGPNVVFDKAGILAMANAGPGTNRSQFFITSKATPWLNGGYTIFGYLSKGMEVFRKLESVPTGGRSNGNRPLEPQRIIKATLKKER